MRSRLVPMLLAVAAAIIAPSTIAQNRQESRETTSNGPLQLIDGFIPLRWDARGGKMLMQISRFDREFLYQISLPAGIGSNPIGLDRGQLGESHVVFFQRIGSKVLLVKPNYGFRALSNNTAERRAVEDSFARSIIWGFKIESETAESVTVDATAFFLRDAHGVIERLRQARQGSYRFDESRSAFYLPRTKGFPKNTEVETIITVTSDGETGPLVREVAPSSQSLSVREHHSFVELPDNNYQPRELDPRVGVSGISFYDYASPFTEPIEKRWVSRHRLQKKDPNAAVSEPIQPIVYYVDNGAPEPIRSALVEGASWWSAAFEAAGFRNAFIVKVLPEDADPMDIRYNMINWVHRSTRGWSYGASVEDPRTGEIIKGNVTLGSLRIRQDFMLGTGMIPVFANRGIGLGDDGCQFGDLPDLEYLTQGEASSDSIAMSLARIRQLSAHEVGHTLGLAHNFAASSYGRGSVMDYPAPMVEIRNGKLDLSNAYGVGIGPYDKFAITFGYAQFPSPASERSELNRLIENGIGAGMLFLSDADARPPGASHPLANLWDNGSDPIAMLRHEMEVRRIGIEQFGLASVPIGTPLSLLEAKFLALYLHHRYQLQAAVKTLGGVYYTYAVKGPAGPSPKQPHEIVPAAKQREALASVLATMRPEFLAIPKRILDIIPPRAFGYGGGTAEFFRGRTSPDFDPVGAATIAADLAVSGLLNPQRAARLVQFHALDANNPDFAEVLDTLLTQTWGARQPPDSFQATIGMAVGSLVVNRIMELASNPDADVLVRAQAMEALRGLHTRLTREVARHSGHRAATRAEIERFLNRPEALHKQTPGLPTPAGDPIGSQQ
jgi:hypothetical protein